MPRWTWIAAGVVTAYAGFVGLTYGAMRQAPDQFAHYMAAMPGPLQRIIPFPPLWNRARAGSLQPGDQAPAFDLETTDRTGRLRLAELWRERPVALVFGSYT